MFENPVYRAVVHYSDSTTGLIKVRVPVLSGADSVLDISYIGRSAANGVWIVPEIGSQIVVTADDENLTNVFWLQVAPDPVTSLTAIQAQIDTKAPLLNPTFTGTPSAPLALTTTNTAQLATTSFVQQEITALVGGAPTALNTLTELASAINNDASYATTLTTALALKAPLYAASPIGMITAYAGSTAPNNWLMCYGQTVSRTTYASLFSIISTTYNTGGEAGTDFRLPDLRGRTIAGLDNMGGTDALRLSTANNLGTTTGAETVTLTAAQSGLPAHQHANTVTNNAVTSGAGSAHQHANTVTNNAVTSGDAGAHSHTIGLRTGAATSTHNNTNEASAGGGTYATSTGPIYGVGDHNHSVTSNVSITNVNEDAHTHSVTSSVSITNNDNTAANAASAHSVMQPTMTINYIILAGA